MKANLHLRITPEKKAEIEQQAKQAGLSITAFVLMAINEKINQNQKGR